jgi:hypothetical protein
LNGRNKFVRIEPTTDPVSIDTYRGDCAVYDRVDPHRRRRAPEPYVVTVAMASVVAFLTPIGHHGNLLVYGPGHYKFGDFVKVGTPLTFLAAVVVVALAPLIWHG